jgi:hypothetical protein
VRWRKILHLASYRVRCERCSAYHPRVRRIHVKKRPDWLTRYGDQPVSDGSWFSSLEWKEISLLPAMFTQALETNLLFDGKFMRGKSGRGVKLTIRLHLGPRLRTSGAKPPLSLCLHGVKKENLMSAGGL